MDSYCDHWMSVMRRVSSVMCRQQLLQVTSPPKLLAGFGLMLAGMIIIWPSLIIVQNCLLETVSVLWLFLTMLWVGLHCVIVVFPDHTHLLFFYNGTIIVSSLEPRSLNLPTVEPLG